MTPSSYGAAAVMLALFLAQAAPAGAVTCHCFRDRTFEEATPASADPYILATTRNSLAAAAAGMEKGAVVRQRMTGASENDLWLYGFLPARLGISPEQLAGARSRENSWQDTFQKLGRDAGALGEGFKAAVRANDDDLMATALADVVLIRAYGVEQALLDQLHKSGANIAETTLSVLIAGKTGRSATDVYREVRAGRQTWGSILYSLDIMLDNVGEMVMAKVRASK